MISSASPLTGRRVVNTRAAGQAAELDGLLLQRGAVPLPYPCIETAPPEDAAALRQAAFELVTGRFDWVVFTSANAVRAVAAVAAAGGQGGGAPQSCVPPETQLAAVGPGTARAVRLLLGRERDFEPAAFTGETLGRELAARRPGRVLLPVGDLAAGDLPDALRAGGAKVTTVIAYRTVPGKGGVDLSALLQGNEVDAILFTSPSTVDNLALRLAAEGSDWGALRGVCVGCIGPVTAGAAVARGLEVHVRPAEHTLVGLVDALEAFFAARPSRDDRVHGREEGS